MPFPVANAIVDTVNYRLDLNAVVSDSTFYSTQDYYSLIQDLFDEQGTNSLAGAMRLKNPMASRGQFDFVITNKWYITQRLIKHLKGGSISTNGYTNEIYTLSFNASGYTNAVTSDIGKTVVSGANSGKLVDYDNSRRVWKVRSPGVTWGNSLAVTITSGTGAGTTKASGGSLTGEDLHANFYTVGDTVSGNKYFLLGGTIYDGTGWFGSGNSGSGNIHLDILATVKEAGVIIGSSPRVFSRNQYETFDWAEADISGGGRTPIPLATQLDLNNTTAYSTLANYVHTSQGGTGTLGQIKIDFGSYTADINTDNTNESYEARLDVNNQTLQTAYEASKYIVSRGQSSVTIDGVPASVYVSADPSYTPVKSAPFGTFAGGKLFAARGLYPINLQSVDASNYQLVDSNGNPISPPKFVSCTISGLQSGLSVTAYRAKLTDSTEVDPSLYTLATGNNSGGSVLTVQQTIAADTPSTGKIRIVNPATQSEDSYSYTGYNRVAKTFTLSSTLTRNYANTETAYIGYIDTIASGSSVSVAVQYEPTRVGQFVVINVRKGADGFKMQPFTISTPFTETGIAVPATVNEDPVNTNS